MRRRAAASLILSAPLGFSYANTQPPALVLIHGWTCDRTLWNAQIEGLKADARVIALDLPGHGANPPVADESALTMDSCARAITAALDREAVAGPVVLAGHSMGTPVIRQFARLFPKRTRALILVDGTIYTPALAKQAFGRESRYRGAEGFETRRRVVDSYLTVYMTPAVREQIRRVMLAAPESTAVGAMRGLIDPEMWRDESPVAVPTLALYQPQSPLPEAYLRRLFPNLEYHRLANTGHFLMMERPDEFNRLVRRFLARLK